MPYREITIKTDEKHTEELQGFLYTLPIGGLVIDDPKDAWEVKETAPYWVVVEDDLLREKDAPIFVRVYIDEVQIGAEKPRLDAFLKENPDMGTQIHEQTVDEDSWAESWKQFFKPLPIGEKLLIRPTWEEVDEKDRVILSIDPGMAFGSGTHETTQLCLERLEKVDLKDQNVADIGCGSGILSIAAALFGAKHIQAVDIEPMSIRMTEENAEVNGVEDKIDARLGDLLQGIQGPVKLLVSNILAEILLIMIPEMKAVTETGSEIIFSGIIVEKEQAIVDALKENNYEILYTGQEGGWSVVHARRVA